MLSRFAVRDARRAAAVTALLVYPVVCVTPLLRHLLNV
jgi:hypothetical protein